MVILFFLEKLRISFSTLLKNSSIDIFSLPTVAMFRPVDPKITSWIPNPARLIITMDTIIHAKNLLIFPLRPVTLSPVEHYIYKLKFFSLLNRSIISSFVEFANAILIERFSFTKRFFDLGKNISPGIVSMF